METHQKNKYLIIFLFAILVLFQDTAIVAQTKWLNFTNTDNVNDVVFQGDFVWVGTSGGLIKLNQVTGEQIFYNRANSGLPSNGISSLCLDDVGNLWVGSWNDGLTKFNGAKWEVFNEDNSELIHNRILTINCDKDGIVWIGTGMGVNRFVNGKLVKDLEIQGIIRFIDVADSGKVYISTSSGIHKFVDNYQKWSGTLCPHNDIGKLCEAKALLMNNPNDFWVGNENGLFHFLNNNWEKISSTILGFENRTTITAICSDNENNLWVGSSSGSLSKYNGINSEVYNMKNSEFNGGSIRKIKRDLMGNIWICTSSNLYKYNGSFEKIDIKKTIIAQGQSLEVFSDGNKTVWLKNSRDLYSYQKNSIKKFDQTNTKFKAIYSMAFNTNGNIWIGDEDGLVLFDWENWKRFDTLDVILAKRDREIFEKYKDTNWVKKNYKEYLLDEENYSWQVGSYASNLHWDKKNTLWFKSSDALVNFDGKNWILYDTAYSTIPTTRFRDFIIDDQSNIWIGTWGMGLPKYDGEKWSIIDTSNSPLISNQIVSLHNFDKLLFVCTNKGIMTFDGNSWKKISTLELEIEFATCMIKDNKNNYWFGSSTGLYKYDGSKWTVFDISNSGIADNFITSFSIDHAGNLWIVSANRYLSIFNENGIKNENNLKSFLKP